MTLHSGETPMPKDDELWKFIRGHLDETPVVPDDGDKKQTGDQPRQFEFCPLTEEENRYLQSGKLLARLQRL
jgi:hypothetical protein